jgi:hypothetical protein
LQRAHGGGNVEVWNGTVTEDRRVAAPHESGAAVRLLLAFALLASSGCIVPRHESMATAPDAVLTFQSKLARDDVEGELACFSQRFREQSGGLSLQGYATMRDRFLAPLGGFGRCVLRRDSLDDNLVGVEGADGLRMRLVYSLFGHAFEVAAAVEARFTFPDPDGVATGAPLTRKDVWREPRGAAPPRRLVVEWNMPAEAARRLVASGLAWAEIGNEWRLEGVTPLEETPKTGDPPVVPPAAGALRVVSGAPLPVREIGATFGSVRLHVELELGDAAACIRELPDGSILVARGTDAPRLRWEPAAADPR